MMKINLYSKAFCFSGLAKDIRFATSVQFVDFVEPDAKPGHIFKGEEIHNQCMEINIPCPYPRAILVKGAFGPYDSRFPAVQIMVFQINGYVSKTKIFSEISNPDWEQEIGKRVVNLLFRLNKEKNDHQSGVGKLCVGDIITIQCGEKLAIFSDLFPNKTPTEIIEFALDCFEKSLMMYENNDKK